MAFLWLHGEDNDICVLCELGKRLHPVTNQTKSQLVNVIMRRDEHHARSFGAKMSLPFHSWKFFTYTNARCLPNIKYTEVLRLFCSGQTNSMSIIAKCIHLDVSSGQYGRRIKITGGRWILSVSDQREPCMEDGGDGNLKVQKTDVFLETTFPQSSLLPSCPLR
jgi:hypothetical protein